MGRGLGLESDSLDLNLSYAIDKKIPCDVLYIPKYCYLFIIEKEKNPVIQRDSQIPKECSKTLDFCFGF